MTEATRTHPVVRPGFLKGSAVAFMLLLPFVVHSIWDYVEERRLDLALQDIERKGEPMGPPSTSPVGPGSEAERDYRAAAVLASTFSEYPRFTLEGVAAALQTGEWPAGAAALLRSSVSAYEEALAFADRAAGLPFEGFAPWTSYNYLTSDLLNVQRLSGYRAIVRALDGEGEGAVDSLHTEVRIGRALGRFAYWGIVRPADVVQVLERTKAPASALARLGTAFDDLDDDRSIAQWFANLRWADFNDRRMSRGNWWETVERPWKTHVLNGRLEMFSNLVAAAHEPWPERIDRVIAVGGFDNLEGYVLGNASETAGVRCLRMVVAVEHYRREHAEQLPETLAELAPAYVRAIPIDPFSGRALLLKKESDGYSVYSVGTNRRDDGAMDVKRSFTAFPKQYPADVGVRVKYR